MASNAPLRGDAERGALNVADPAPPASPRTAAKSAMLLQIGLLGFFTLTRAIHPLIIGKTKVGGKYPHEPITVPLMECILTLVVAQSMTLMNGGLEQWKAIWDPKPMGVFSVIGFLYAFGDYLELKSLGSLSGPTYQVLSQSKLLITAGMLYGFKGQKQSPLQWILLVLLMLSLCCYSIMGDLLDQHRKLQRDPNFKVSEGSNSTFGMFMAVLKVVVSCLCAVLSDKYMKDYKSEPIYMQLVQFKVIWAITLTVLMFFEANPVRDGLFYEWKPVTVAALVSFTVKGWSTMYLLAILDSMLKNIGEACSVLVIYFIVVFHASFDDEYENETFITVLVVFLSVVAYLAAKDVSTKADKYDRMQLKGNVP